MRFGIEGSEMGGMGGAIMLGKATEKTKAWGQGPREGSEVQP